MCRTYFIFRIIVAFVCSLILVTTKLAFIYFVPDIQIKFKSHCATCSAAAQEECERNTGGREEAGHRWSECMACPWAQSKGLQIDKDMRLLGEQLTPVHVRVHVPAQPLSCSILLFFLSLLPPPTPLTSSLSGQSSAGAACNPEGCHNFICWRRRLLLLPLPMASSSAPAAAAQHCKGFKGGQRGRCGLRMGIENRNGNRNASGHTKYCCWDAESSSQISTSSSVVDIIIL